jgi:sialic acid synthase
MNMAKPVLIAEVGCNHKGDMNIAKEMIRIAKLYSGADVVKFQKRCSRELLTLEQYNAPHPDPRNSYGATYGEHREFLEFSLEEHRELKAHAESFGIEYSCSVWDMTSAREIAGIGPRIIKIPSACNNNSGMAQWLCDNYPGEIHVSSGMTTSAELDGIVELFSMKGRSQDLVLYHCVSGYPVDFADCFLLEIARIKERYAGAVKAVGFSGHHLGIAIDIAALSLGASFFERHFTLDRTWKGTDHAASLEPDGLRKLKRDLDAASASLKAKVQEIAPIEAAQRDKLKYRPPLQQAV